MHTPDEAVDELEYAVDELGFKAVLHARATCSARSRRRSTPIRELAQYAVWTRQFGIDSAYDYDPVWEKCRELGVAVAFHSGSIGLAEPGVDLELHVQPPRRCSPRATTRWPSRCSSAA